MTNDGPNIIKSITIPMILRIAMVERWMSSQLAADGSGTDEEHSYIARDQ